jgi:CRISPR-associated endonuclease/helicase Cas3
MVDSAHASDELLAHSAQDGRPAQTYAAHVAGQRGVTWRAWRNAQEAGRHSEKLGTRLLRAARLSGEFHDLGKVDPYNQQVLHKANSRESLPVKHWDAGVAALFHHAAAKDASAAAAVYAHHKGLPNWEDERKRDQLAYREEAVPQGRAEKTCTFNDTRLQKFLDRHNEAITIMQLPPVPDRCAAAYLPPLFHRLVLSCLVDADHTDTAVHRTGKEAPDGVPLRPLERLAALQGYVDRLSANETEDSRRSLRQLVFNESIRASTAPNLLFCDSPVGTGKTTAVMAHLLRAAGDKGLRRVFVVLPYTNIITQSARVYRCALALRGEKSRDVVAEHHHRTEFPEGENERDSPARQYACLWHAPIVVVTAVQFFETLAGASTVDLRKLHQLPGSAIFIDEAHAALPAKLWPQAFRWLRQLVDDWGCHCVLASGSLPEFWQIKEFIDMGAPAVVPALLPDSCRRQASDAESSRVDVRAESTALTLQGLADALKDSPGPQVLVVNTVQNAAVIAEYLRSAQGSGAVEHVSTALTPRDRAKSYDRIHQRLHDRRDRNWTLVATSCIEAGVDFDFASGFRERASLMSLLQLSGRVNRHGLREQGRLLDFTLAPHPLLNQHPAFEQSALVLGELFREGKVHANYCREALRRELDRVDIKPFLDRLKMEENALSFDTVKKLFRVISAQTFTAVVEPELIDRLANFQPIPFRDLQDGSVQLWLGKEREFALPEFPHLRGVYRWNFEDGYDAFLGVMKGILPLLRAQRYGIDIL